jgi:hypothetical protein
LPGLLTTELGFQNLRRCSSCKTTYDGASFRKEVKGKENGEKGKLLSTCYRCRFYKGESRRRIKEEARRQEKEKEDREKEDARQPYTYRVSKSGCRLGPPTDFPYKKHSADNPTFTYNVETLPVTSVIKQPPNRPSFGLLDTPGAPIHAVAQAVGFQERRGRVSALYEGPYYTHVKVPPNTAAQERERRRKQLEKEQWERWKQRREQEKRRREEKKRG